jgi:hypothetical protein
MTTPAVEGHPRNAHFLDLCLLYGDFNRPVFLEAILRSFVESAGAKEMAALRRAIRDRAKLLKQNRAKGRPSTEQNPAWIRRSLQIVWQREILHWQWRKIAAAADLAPTRPNFRTLKRRYNLYAMLVWRATHGRTDDPKALNRMLKAKPIQRWYRSQLGLPFDTHPEECKRLVRTLARQGLHRAATIPNPM